MCEIDGKISFVKTIRIRKSDNYISWWKRQFWNLDPRSKYLNEEGDFVKKGDILVEGTPVPHDILRILGIEELARYQLEVQSVYKFMYYINDKHIETIVRQGKKFLLKTKIKSYFWRANSKKGCTANKILIQEGKRGLNLSLYYSE